MTDREINNLLWRAFLLGARVVADQNGKEVSGSDISTLGEVIRQIAASDATLEDPTALAARSPDIGELLVRLGTLNIRNNRDLAKRIFEGFMIATDVKE
jgi:hypothetical protein